MSSSLCENRKIKKMIDIVGGILHNSKEDFLWRRIEVAVTRLIRNQLNLSGSVGSNPTVSAFQAWYLPGFSLSSHLCDRSRNSCIC